MKNRGKHEQKSYNCATNKHENCTGIIYQSDHIVIHCKCGCHDPERTILDSFN